VIKLKIGMISRWNATCGVSVHAELIGREWVRMGHELKIYAPLIESASRDWHHKLIESKDEPWVTRCYWEPSEGDFGWINPEPILRDNPEILVIQSHVKLPTGNLAEITRKVKAKIIAIIHNTSSDEVINLLKARIDVMVVFDERYIREVLSPHGVDRSRIRIIPYPCPNIKVERKSKPSFARGKYLFFSFGRQPPREYMDFINVLRELKRKHDLLYWIVRSNSPLSLDESWIIQLRRRLTLEELLNKIAMADLHLIPKGTTNRVVVSSTVYQTIVAPTPIIIRDSRYVEDIPTDNQGFGPVVKYSSTRDLRNKIEVLIEDKNAWMRVIREAQKFAEEHNSRKIALMFIELFKELLSE